MASGCCDAIAGSLVFQKILSAIFAIEIRFKKVLNEERKIEFVQSCAGNNYAQVIAIADRISQIKLEGTCNMSALELCKAMKKTWQITGHKYDKEEDDGKTMTANSLKHCWVQ
jgi:hypothetical protein